jgi:hypothetical protein
MRPSITVADGKATVHTGGGTGPVVMTEAEAVRRLVAFSYLAIACRAIRLDDPQVRQALGPTAVDLLLDAVAMID